MKDNVSKEEKIEQFREILSGSESVCSSEEQDPNTFGYMSASGTRMKHYEIIMMLLLLMLLVGCGDDGQVMDGDGMFQVFEYKQISQGEAKQMMDKDDGHVIVDVRRADEYAEGHIPGAILIPNESIENEPPEALPDFDQIILIYCRSGRRSKEAAQKLADMGYSNVYEFGGIIDWTGEIVSEDQSMTTNAFVTVRVGDSCFSVDLEGNSSAEAFFEKLKKEDIEIDMHDYGHLEKVGDLPWVIPTNDEEITTEPGDLILYQGNKITVYYDENTWSFTKLGRLNGTPEEIKEVFGGEDDITAEFFLEWTE